MLTPKRSGLISPEEIGNESETRIPGSTGNCSTASSTYRNDSLPEEFLASRRVGRRNALTYAESETVDLPNRFKELSMEIDESSTEDLNPSTPSTSKQQQ